MARGRILAVKWGMNPNSSSLGVDVTFLLVGATAVAMLTPMLGALIRLRRARLEPTAAAPAGPSPASPPSGPPAPDPGEAAGDG